MDHMNVAIVGFGGMGSWHHKMMTDSGLMTVVGIYDICEERRKVAGSLGLRVYDSPMEIGVQKDVDAVLIATPNDLHLPYAELFAPYKKHLICEKPAAICSSDFEKMAELAFSHGVLLAVHQNRRWDPDFLTMEQIAREGLIGNVYYAESAVTGSHGIPGDWRKQKSRGGGMVLDWGVHLVDQLLEFDPSPVVSTECSLSYCEGFEVDDGFTLTLTFESGFKGTVIVDTNCFINRPRWRIQGADGTAVIENWSREGKIVRVKERQDRFLKGIDAGNGYTKTMADRSAVTVEQLDLPKPEPEPFAFYRNVLSAAGGGELAVKPCEVLRVQKIMDRALAGMNGRCRI